MAAVAQIFIKSEAAQVPDIVDLGAMLRANGLAIETVNDPTPVGVKGDGLIVGLTVATLAVNTLSAAIATLSLWRERRPKYALIFRFGDSEIHLDGDASEIPRDVLREIEGDVEIEIHESSSE